MKNQIAVRLEPWWGPSLLQTSVTIRCAMAACIAAGLWASGGWGRGLVRACGRRWVGHGVGGELVEPFFILRLALFGRRRGWVVNGHRFAWRRVGLPKRRCHLRAERKVCAGFPDGHRRPEWGRQDDAAQGLAGAGPADPGVDGMPVA